MSNEYQLRVRRGDFDWQFSELNVPIRWADAEPNRPLDRPFKPTNRATIIRAIDPSDPMAGVEGLEARWWMAHFFHKGPVSAWKAMCTNARLETVDTTAVFREPYKRGRALMSFSQLHRIRRAPRLEEGRAEAPLASQLDAEGRA